MSAASLPRSLTYASAEGLHREGSLWAQPFGGEANKVVVWIIRCYFDHVLTSSPRFMNRELLYPRRYYTLRNAILAT